MTAPTPDLLLRGRVVTPDSVLPDAVVVVTGDTLTAVVPADAASPELLAAAGPATDDTLLPGLVDVHCHGGGGASFPDSPDAATARRAIAEHLRHGTTSLVASLVTAPPEVLLARTAVLADLADAGELAGIHLEGPFLSARRCGAQNPDDMRPGDAALVREVARVARGHLFSMTVAPDVPGVLGPDGAVAALAEAGAVASIGHTDATAAVTRDAITEAFAAQAGRTRPRPTATHLFNGMPSLHHRAPGPVAELLAAAARGEIVVELVADGTHLDPATVAMVFDTVGAGSIALVTDAMAAAGMPDGDYELGPMAVRVRGGVARLADGDAIAGGTAHLLDEVRTTVAHGVSLVDAVRAAATTPAALLGRTDIGALAPGLRADLVVTDAGLHPRRVLRAGAWVAEGAA